MDLMNDKTEKAIHLLTILARGDVSLVRLALVQHERHGVQTVIEFIKQSLKNREAPGSARRVSARPAGNC